MFKVNDTDSEEAIYAKIRALGKAIQDIQDDTSLSEEEKEEIIQTLKNRKTEE